MATGGLAVQSEISPLTYAGMHTLGTSLLVAVVLQGLAGVQNLSGAVSVLQSTGPAVGTTLCYLLRTGWRAS